MVEPQDPRPTTLQALSPEWALALSTLDQARAVVDFVTARSDKYGWDLNLSELDHKLRTLGA